MPYYCHDKEAEPETGRKHATGEAARSDRQPSELVTYVDDDDEREAWQRRERGRFETNEYIRVPWVNADRHYDHFVHLSVKTPGLIAYTKSAQHGVEDRQTTIRPGRYLEQFYSDYPQNMRDKWIGECGASTLELKITKDADEIEEVYVHGPHSCMAHESRHFDSSIHPARVYADGDLALAYCGPRNGAHARSVVWPDRKIHSRIYGNIEVLRALLETAGYKDDSIRGAKVKAVHDDGDRWVLPYVDYIDGASLVRINGVQYFVFDGHGEYAVNNTNGIAGETSTCEHCGDYYSNSESEYLCQHCYENTSVCEDCDRRVDDDNMSGDRCESCASNYWECDGCSEEFNANRNSGNSLESGRYCNDCYEDEKSECANPDCSEKWHEEELRYSKQRSRQTRGVTTLCPDCGDEFDICDICAEIYDATLSECPECSNEETSILRAESEGMPCTC